MEEKISCLHVPTAAGLSERPQSRLFPRAHTLLMFKLWLKSKKSRLQIPYSVCTSKNRQREAHGQLTGVLTKQVSCIHDWSGNSRIPLGKAHNNAPSLWTDGVSRGQQGASCRSTQTTSTDKSTPGAPCREDTEKQPSQLFKKCRRYLRQERISPVFITASWGGSPISYSI